MILILWKTQQEQTVFKKLFYLSASKNDFVNYLTYAANSKTVMWFCETFQSGKGLQR
jgi:hypothetical protein